MWWILRPSTAFRGLTSLLSTPRILFRTLQAPHVPHVDYGEGQESVPLQQSEQTSSYLRLCKKERSPMMGTSKTQDIRSLGVFLTKV